MKPIRIISRHQTERIATAHRRVYERLQVAAKGSGDAAGSLLMLDIPVDAKLVTRHERFRRYKWAVGVVA